MPTQAETLGAMIEDSLPLATRYFAGFDDANRAAQLPHMPNHFAWTLGHCALTMHRFAERIDRRPLPGADFAEGVEVGPGVPPMAFGTEGVCFGSIPVSDAARYPTVARATQVFGAAFDRFASAVRTLTDEQLDSPQPWGRAEMPMRSLVTRVAMHNAMHTGQLVDLRRGLGLGRVVG